MTMAMTESRRLNRPGASRFGGKLAAAFVLVVLADLLFYDRDAGISIAVFAALVSAALAVTGVPPAAWTRTARAAAFLVASLLPVVENVSALSVLAAFAGNAVFSLVATGRLRSGVGRAARQVAGFVIAATFRFVPDMVRWRTAARRLGTRAPLGWLAAWILPLGLGGVFVLLFGVANPVVEGWLDKIELWRLLDLLEVTRIAFWMLVLLAVWGYLRPCISWFQRPRRAMDLIGPIRPKPARPAHPLGNAVFGETAILRALVLFNALFAVETVLDLAYLWGGVALPDGMTYAAYAHRGAYPLIVTALLAAAFVLGATRDGSRVGGNRLIRVLLYAWTVQNVLLVISSMLRLDLYVEVYALTYWRVSAFVWMGLVATGLVLILARMALAKSNAWLLSANLLTLFATLYACCFVNVAAMIASYNVEHRPLGAGGSAAFDPWYLGQLGEQAIPAIDRLLAEDHARLGDCAGQLGAVRDDLAAALGERLADWRAWTFQDWRLMRYLEEHPRPTWTDGAVREKTLCSP